MSTTTPVTADQLLKMPDDGYRYELVAGELRKMSPGNWEHGLIIDNLQSQMSVYARTKRIGRVFGAETGFLIASDPDTVRAPDIAFARQERFRGKRPARAFWPGAPDLVVEVVSPGDTLREVADKVSDWLGAGAAMVWVVDPDARTVVIHRSGKVRKVGEGDVLDGEELLPGFRLPVSEIFDLW